MPHVKLHCPHEAAFNAGFARIRTEFQVETSFASDVAAAAATATGSAMSGDRTDARSLDLVTIDPAGSRDLDQAFTAGRRGSGFTVNYAIADVASFVEPGGPIDLSTRTRGVTFYAPDQNAPLHPDAISEGAASLLPGQDTPALLWTILLEADGSLADARVERAIVNSRAALSYSEVADDLESASPDPRHLLLREIGLLRLDRERDRGGVSLNLASQEVVHADDHYALEYRKPLPVEDWNAQISLLTGMAAAQIMLDGGVGILRTLPPTDGGTIQWLRRTSNALSVSYPKDKSYPDWVRSLDGAIPAHAALQTQAARAFRGAGYMAFDGATPEDPGHAALATTYSHVTAPLRRLVDRYANEIVLALCAGRRPEGWALEMLEAVPDIMAGARQRSGQFEKALVDFAEVMVMAGKVGQRFDAIVTDRRNDRITLQLTDPAVIARIKDDEVSLGKSVTVELSGTDEVQRRLQFEVVADR